MGPRLRLLLLVLATVVPLLAAPGLAPSATAAPSSIATRAPAPGDDFPRLPAQCYDDRGVITSPCRITSFTGRPMVVLWGDSHAQMYLPALRQVARNQRVNLTAVLFGGCPVSKPFPRSAGYPRTGCDEHNVESLAYVRDLTQRRSRVRVLVGGFWSGYRQAYDIAREEDRTGVPSGLSDYRKHMAALGVERTRPMFGAIGRLGVPVDMIGQAATVPLDPRRCAAGREPYQCDLPRHRALHHEGDNERWIRRTLMAPLPGRPRLIDATPSYCTRSTCLAHVRGLNTFYDDIHLGAGLTRTLAAYFRPVFRDALAR
ncbi:MAG: hypothetical protein JWN84_2575 [Nocardioides sp.]|nr:hypothetical protein [Nocardioides sp.]